jgi:hypothetical protein
MNNINSNFFACHISMTHISTKIVYKYNSEEMCIFTATVNLLEAEIGVPEMRQA